MIETSLLQLGTLLRVCHNKQYAQVMHHHATTTTTPQPPHWQVLNEGSFASVRVRLPPSTAIHCESDAVVTMSHTVNVCGVVSGGLWAGLARAFLTRESFFTTVVENTSLEETGDVLLAPSDPGGIALHRFTSSSSSTAAATAAAAVADDDSGDMLLCSGAYLAADEGVAVESVMQAQFKNSIFSGTGFFLLRASSVSSGGGGGGDNCLAISAYGSMHKYELGPGERRMVDNGHLVAWTASMKYTMKLASAGSGLLGSMTSGEGLHCEFEGPGTIYIQSHKPATSTSTGEGSQRRSGGEGPVGACAGCFFAILFLALIATILFAGLEFNQGFYPTRSPSGRYSEYPTYGGQHQQYHHPQHYRYNERLRSEL